jgi:hypothetical protein
MEEKKDVNQEEEKKNASNIFVTIAVSVFAVVLAFVTLVCMRG